MYIAVVNHGSNLETEYHFSHEPSSSELDALYSKHDEINYIDVKIRYQRDESKDAQTLSSEEGITVTHNDQNQNETTSTTQGTVNTETETTTSQENVNGGIA